MERLKPFLSKTILMTKRGKYVSLFIALGIVLFIGATIIIYLNKLDLDSEDKVLVICPTALWGCKYFGQSGIRNALHDSKGRSLFVKQGTYTFSEDLIVGNLGEISIIGEGPTTVINFVSARIIFKDTPKVSLQSLKLTHNDNEGNILLAIENRDNPMDILIEGVIIGGKVNYAYLGGSDEICPSSVMNIKNNIFTGNSGKEGGLVIISNRRCDMAYSIINNTFVNFISTALVPMKGSKFIVSNNIFAFTKGINPSVNSNWYAGYGVGINNTQGFKVEPYFSNNLFFENEAGCSNIGEICSTSGSKVANPAFVDVGTGHYNLMPESDAIDTGNSAFGQDQDGSKIDIGAYGGPGRCFLESGRKPICHNFRTN